MRVIGTAGHVDHGKSTLVRALTDIDPDRLAEEKARQMTIDLGFAWFDLPNGETIGIVDVPGHQDFIENMLAGVGSIDAVLFVIAADEGIMPQTREHLAIIDLLAIEVGVVALTKSDLITDPEWLELIQEDVTALLQNTALAHAPIVPLSAHTGAGLASLVTTLQDTLAKYPPRADYGRPRLFVDRVFSMTGFGTIVTGTLTGGQLRVGDDIVIQPQGKQGRIRGLQSYQKTVNVAHPGSRVAANLAGIDSSEVKRGQAITLANQWKASALLDVHFHHLASAKQPLKHHTEVRFFCGSAEINARVRLIGNEILLPDEVGWLQLRLERPIVAQRGDRFILRRLSPPETIGGGLIIDAHPSRRWRRFRPEVIAHLERQLSASPSEHLSHSAETSEPLKAHQLQQMSGFSDEIFASALTEALEKGLIVAVGEHHYWGAKPYTRAKQRLLAELVAYHQAEPLRLGMSREALRSRIGVKQATLSYLLHTTEEVFTSGELVYLNTHSIQLNDQQESAAATLMQKMLDQRYTPPSFTMAVELVGEPLLRALIDLGHIVQVQADVIFAREVYDEFVGEVINILQAEGSISVKRLRDRFNTSRKYAIGILEHLDALGVTRRIGDERVPGRHGISSRPE